jgi:hypothetical protein
MTFRQMICMLPCDATEFPRKQRQGSRDQSFLVRIALFADSTAARHPAANTVFARPTLPTPRPGALALRLQHSG